MGWTVVWSVKEWLQCELAVVGNSGSGYMCVVCVWALEDDVTVQL